MCANRDFEVGEEIQIHNGDLIEIKHVDDWGRAKVLHVKTEKEFVMAEERLNKFIRPGRTRKRIPKRIKVYFEPVAMNIKVMKEYYLTLSWDSFKLYCLIYL